MKKEIIYARQSLDKKDSVSIEAQIEHCKKFLTSDSYEVYIDKGWSGKNTDRPKMNQLISDVKNDKVSRIISYRLDRISRNIVDFGNLLSLFEKHNVEYISATENFDTSSPMGRAMVYIVMVFAQLERETIATRITDNYKFRCATGKYFMGGNIPYGYKTEKVVIDGKKNSVLIHGDNAIILMEIFNRFVSGDSLGSIVKSLNSRNILTVNNKFWSSLGVKRILRNITPCVADEKICNYLTACGYNITNPIEEFNGEYGMCIFLKNKDRNVETEIADRVVAIGLHKPVIPSDIFIKAQLMLDKNAENTTPKTSQNTFLAGLVKCKECGYSFGLKSTRKYHYYVCRSRLSKGVCDNDRYIKAEELEKDAVDNCYQYLNVVKHKLVSQESKKQETSILNHSDQIRLLENQIDNFLNSIGQGNSVVDDLLTKKITETHNKINELKRATLESVSMDINNEDLDILIKDLESFDDMSIDEKHNTMKKIIKNIEVPKEGKYIYIFKKIIRI